MPKCKNVPTRKYKGTEPSPKGLGYCAHSMKVGVVKKGKDGNKWIVKEVKNGSKRWMKVKVDKKVNKIKDTNNKFNIVINTKQKSIFQKIFSKSPIKIELVGNESILLKLYIINNSNNSNNDNKKFIKKNIINILNNSLKFEDWSYKDNLEKYNIPFNIKFKKSNLIKISENDNIYNVLLKIKLNKNKIKLNSNKINIDIHTLFKELLNIFDDFIWKGGWELRINKIELKIL
tara:strand:- start:832 stop:1527 length:696 start_codon:yes stop_codon:yes gene_type:complete